MKMRLLGQSGLKVSELCLGTMTFGTETAIGSEEDECRRVFDAYLEAGGNFIDTANIYTFGTSERMLGRFIAGQRASLVIATKYAMNTDLKNPNSGGNSRKPCGRRLRAVSRASVPITSISCGCMPGTRGRHSKRLCAVSTIWFVRAKFCTRDFPTFPPGSWRARRRSPSAAIGRGW